MVPAVSIATPPGIRVFRNKPRYEGILDHFPGSRGPLPDGFPSATSMWDRHRPGTIPPTPPAPERPTGNQAPLPDAAPGASQPPGRGSARAIAGLGLPAKSQRRTMHDLDQALAFPSAFWHRQVMDSLRLSGRARRCAWHGTCRMTARMSNAASCPVIRPTAAHTMAFRTGARASSRNPWPCGVRPPGNVKPRPRSKCGKCPLRGRSLGGCRDSGQ